MPKSKQKRFFLVMTDQEREIIKQEAQRRGMLEEESNILREGLRLYFDKYGSKLPEGAFKDRRRGNKSPKELALSSLITSRASNSTETSELTLVPALLV